MVAGTTPGNRVRLRPSLRAATSLAATTSSVAGVLISTSRVCTHLGEVRTNARRCDERVEPARSPAQITHRVGHLIDNHLKVIRADPAHRALGELLQPRFWRPS